jgi:hypothetical protein
MATDEENISKIVHDIREEEYDSRADAAMFYDEDGFNGALNTKALNIVFGTTATTTTTMTTNEGEGSDYESSEVGSSEDDDDDFNENVDSDADDADADADESWFWDEGCSNWTTQEFMDKQTLWQQRKPLKDALLKQLDIEFKPRNLCRLAWKEFDDNSFYEKIDACVLLPPDVYPLTLLYLGIRMIDGEIKEIPETILKDVLFPYLIADTHMIPSKLTAKTFYFTVGTNDNWKRTLPEYQIKPGKTHIHALKKGFARGVTFDTKNYALEEHQTVWITDHSKHEEKVINDIRDIIIIGRDAMHNLAVRYPTSCLSVIAKCLLVENNNKVIMRSFTRWMGKIAANLPNTIYLMELFGLMFEVYADDDIDRQGMPKKSAKRVKLHYGGSKRKHRSDILLKLMFEMSTGTRAEFRTYFPATVLTEENKLSQILRSIHTDWSAAKNPNDDNPLPATEECPLPIVTMDDRFYVDYLAWNKQPRNTGIRCLRGNDSGVFEDFHGASSYKNEINVNFEPAGGYKFIFNDNPTVDLLIQGYDPIAQKDLEERRRVPLSMDVDDIEIAGMKVREGIPLIKSATKVHGLEKVPGEMTRSLKIQRIPVRVEGCNRIEDYLGAYLKIFDDISKGIHQTLGAQGTPECGFVYPFEDGTDIRWLVYLMCRYFIHINSRRVTRATVEVGNDFWGPINKLVETNVPYNIRILEVNRFKPIINYRDEKVTNHPYYFAGVDKLFEHVKEQGLLCDPKDDFTGTYFDILWINFNNALIRPLRANANVKAALTYTHTHTRHNICAEK